MRSLFIAASRRTNDLYAGSQLLVEIANEVAKFVGDKGKLIFPSDAKADGPNKILVLLNEGESPATVAEAAKGVANEFLAEEWKKVNVPGIVHTLAQDQIEHFLEFYAAWVPLEDNYDNARRQVERLLASRKALRNFEPPVSFSGKNDARPKSPLDPSRDCVLPRKLTDECRRKLYLKETETLDAISVLKRWNGIHKVEGDSVPSTSMMAFRAYEPFAVKKIPCLLDEIDGLIGQISDGGFRPDRGDVFLREKLAPKKNDKDNYVSERDKQILNELEGLGKQANYELSKAGVGKPQPYYAILVADGDKMGKIIGGLDSIDGHKALSTALSAFAKEAKSIITKHHGHPVYTGGDDVLAFLPVNTALDCSKKLSVCFAEKIEASLKQSRQIEGGTLSVGVAIVHHLENLRLSLENGRAAEKVAKRERNSLAVALHTRGGSPLTVVEKWVQFEDEPKWETWINAFRGDLSRGFPYELRDLVRDWNGCYENSEKMNRFQAEADRIFKRTHKPLDLRAVRFFKSPDGLLKQNHQSAEVARHRCNSEYTLIG